MNVFTAEQIKDLKELQRILGVNYIAMDKDDVWSAYESKPCIMEGLKIWIPADNNVPIARITRITGMHLSTEIYWKASCFKIDDLGDV